MRVNLKKFSMELEKSWVSWVENIIYKEGVFVESYGISTDTMHKDVDD
jgi:hypothetical protein